MSARAPTLSWHGLPVIRSLLSSSSPPTFEINCTCDRPAFRENGLLKPRISSSASGIILSLLPMVLRTPRRVRMPRAPRPQSNCVTRSATFSGSIVSTGVCSAAILSLMAAKTLWMRGVRCLNPSTTMCVWSTNPGSPTNLIGNLPLVFQSSRTRTTYGQVHQWGVPA